MPFGLRMSQDIFQLKIVVIVGEPSALLQTTSLYPERMTNNMERTRKAGIKLKDEECIIKTKECNFFGMLFTPDGVKPSPDKIKAIEQQEPHTQGQKGATHASRDGNLYMSSFISRLADHVAPLRDLLKEDVDCAWNTSHSRAFEKVKSLIFTATTLVH